MTARPELALAAGTGAAWSKRTSARAGKVIVWLRRADGEALGHRGAGFQVALPAWFAVMVQVPVVRSVTLVPETVHTAAVVELKLTARPEEAVAPMVTGESARVLLARAPKVMVWSPLLMVKVRLTWGAAFQVALPAWSASIGSCPRRAA